MRVHETRSEAHARALIEDLHRQLLGGAEFAALARRHSEDPHAPDGGLMGWVAEGELMPELDTALFALEAGELSSPIQSRLGFHLLHCTERRSASSLSLLEANRAVYERIYRRKFEAALATWLDDLKQRAYIEILTATPEE